ncbi:hypothetical protein A6X21_17090 [Planctopirus hydrillae]|uniref:Uncharacterized protein n=1 Tax=Planctopirus hydrillae TaxID=1841610 RepID=A0A1C3EQI9_9PLAN|nr:hypothetical protein A6X21_17090 [Planctopirus hydrillae]
MLTSSSQTLRYNSRQQVTDFPNNISSSEKFPSSSSSPNGTPETLPNIQLSKKIKSLYTASQPSSQPDG